MPDMANARAMATGLRRWKVSAERQTAVLLVAALVGVQKHGCGRKRQLNK